MLDVEKTKNEIIDLFDSKILDYQNRIDSIQTLLSDDTKKLENIANILNLSITDQTCLDNITDSDIKFLESLSMDVSSLKVLIVCKKVIELNNDNTSCILELKNNIEDKLVEIKNNNKEKFQEKLEILKDLQNKIINNCLLFSEEDINKISEIFDDMNLSIEDKIKYMSLLNIIYHDNNFAFEIEEDDDELKITNLNEYDLEKLFKKYNYNINDFGIYKQIMLKHGVLENIENLLIILQKYNVDLNYVPSNWLNSVIIEKAKQLAWIFATSRPEILTYMLDLYQNNLVSIGTDAFYSEFFNFPTRFKAETKSKIIPQNSDGVDSDTFIVGRHTTYRKNFDLLKTEYDNYVNNNSNVTYTNFFTDICTKCGDIFQINNDILQQNLNFMKMYGVGPEYYLTTLSGLRINGIVAKMDLALEIGAFEYLKENLSITNDSNENLFLIDRSKRNGIPNSDIYKDLNLNQNFGSETKKKVLNKKYLQSNLRLTQPIQYFKLGSYFNSDEMNIINHTSVLISNSENNSLLCAKQDVNKKGSFLNELEQYASSKDPRVYDFNGIRISKLKVFRLYTTLLKNRIELSRYNLIYILTYMSPLTQFEFLQIVNIVDNILNKGVKIK